MNKTKKAANMAPVFLLLACVALFIAAVTLREQIPHGMDGLLWAAVGICGGFGTTGLAALLTQEKRTPEQLRELELAQSDERNVTIREKAAYSSWHWTTWLLWGAFLVAVVTQGGFYVALISVVLVLHSVFYIINLRRWANKL